MTKYVLISAARDEAKFVNQLIASVSNQTTLPSLWVIVSDGSTDGTDALVEAQAEKCEWIKLVRSEKAGGRSFGSKALALIRAYQEVRDLDFEFIGNLDADVTFASNYYQTLIAEMQRNPRLGVCSGVCWDKTPDGFRRVTISLNHAVGAMQFFRRRCFDEVGGFHPTSVGGVDSLAELMARMKGWQTRAFPELPFYHHKPVDSANGRNAVRISYRAGLTEYHIGTHPLFAVAKAIRRWRSAPMLFSPVVRMAAYFALWIRRVKRDAPDDLVKYVHREQLRTLFKACSSPVKLFRRGPQIECF